MGYNLIKQKPRRNNPKVITPEILDEIISSIPQNEDSTEPLVASLPKVLSQDSKGSLLELPTNLQTSSQHLTLSQELLLGIHSPISTEIKTIPDPIPNPSTESTPMPILESF